MGWTYKHTNLTASEELRQYVEGQGYYLDGPDKLACPSPYRLLDLAIVAMREAYMAVQDIRDGKVRAWVFLVDLKKGRDGMNYGYKDMDESMGPCAVRCPKRILDLLSPVDESYPESSREYAQGWRDACRATIARREALKVLKDGTRIQLATPLRFLDGVDRDSFTVRMRGRRRGFQGTDGVMCAIRGLEHLKFSLVA